MSNRTVRIAELVQRELSGYLHTKYQAEAVNITVSGVEVAPDLKTGKIFFSILGGPEAEEQGLRWLKQKWGELRRELAHRVQIKHAPEWIFLIDEATPRGNRVLDLLDELEGKESKPNP
jgi:ribosome-binding factor A